MTQTLTYIPNPKPIPQTTPLRLTPITDPPKESVPRATDSLKKSVPSANTLPPPQPASPKPQGEPSLERLLTLYLDPELSIADIAFTLGLSIPHTLQLVRRQDFLDALWVYSHEHEKRANYLACCNIDTAARTFVRLTSSDKPETARKAAGAIVRMHAETKPEKISPETRLKAAATLLNANPPPITPDAADKPSKPHARHPNAPTRWNPDRKGGGSRGSNQANRADRRLTRRAERLADTLGITPDNAAVAAETLAKRLQEIDELRSRVSGPSDQSRPRPKPRSGESQ